jgi:hypothetical protein
VHLDRLPESCHEDWTVEDAIQDKHDEMGPVEIRWVRPFYRERDIGITTVRIVTVDRAYGGPEEGGWYYDVEQLVRQFTVPNSALPRLRRRLEQLVEVQNSQCRRWDYENKWKLRTGPLVVRPRPHYC